MGKPSYWVGFEYDIIGKTLVKKERKCRQKKKRVLYQPFNRIPVSKQKISNESVAEARAYNYPVCAVHPATSI